MNNAPEQQKMTEVDLPPVEVHMPPQGELKAKTACLCVHCGLYLPEDKKKMLFMTGKVGALCMSSATDCKFGKHGAFSASIGKSYCLDLDRDYMGKDGWLYQQSEGKTLFCINTKNQMKCAKEPFVILKGVEQCLCCDVRCALPFDSEVPMQIACCGKVLYPK